MGANYLTRTGLPVRVLLIVLPAVYPLEPFDEGEATSPVKPAPPEPGPGSHSPAAQARKLLAPIIDALLVKGGISMLVIVRAVKRKASASWRGRDLKANIRARMYWFRKKGYTIERDELCPLKARPTHQVPPNPPTSPLNASQSIHPFMMRRHPSS